MKTMHKQVVMIVLLLILGSTNEKNLLKGDPINTFCWKDTEARGVGKVPNCAPDQDRIGLLCYPKCPQAMTRYGFDCHSDCPRGWDNHGLFCRHSEYGRAGYGWMWGDSWTDGGMFARCGQANGGRQNCEKYGLVVYPKCRPGFSSFGCCICRPEVPDCSKFNLNAGVDLSCAKKIIIGSPTTGVCEQNEEKDGGLCYPACKTGYYGVGPVCWANPPNNWVHCGMGAALNTKACTTITFNQVTSVGNLAFNIASLGYAGASGMSAGAAKGTVKVSSFPKLAARVGDLKRFYAANQTTINNAKNGAKIAAKIVKMSTITNKLVNVSQSQDVLQAEDVIRIAAEISSLVDPTGISVVISSYTYPKCSKIFSF